ncbi:choline ABC transporter permease, partial [Actinomycetes bacterium NPDC127524]
TMLAAAVDYMLGMTERKVTPDGLKSIKDAS